MNYLNERIRRNARAMLRQNWSKAVALTLALTAAALLISLLESGLSALLGIYGVPSMLYIYRGNLSMLFPERILPSLLLSAGLWLLEAALLYPLMLGISEWYFHLTYGGREDNMRDVFRHFRSGRNFFRAVWLYLNMSVRSSFYMAVLLLPGGAMILTSMFFTQGNPSSLDRIMAIMGLAIGVCLVALGLITGYIFTRRYQLAPYLIADNDSLTAGQALKLSVQATKGFKTGYAWFQFGFVGWGLLSVLMLPLFYTVPYFWGSNALYARTLMEVRKITTRSGPSAGNAGVGMDTEAAEN